MGSVDNHAEEEREYVFFSENDIKYLPEEWRKYFFSLKEEGEILLVSASEDLKKLRNMVHAFQTMASLSYIHHRLTSVNFEPTIEWFYENDMLTSAFVNTYARLFNKGIGGKVSRGKLPAELRSVHDEIINLRNKRYAHNDYHESVFVGIEVGFEGGKFDVSLQYNMGTHVGGAPKWGALVEFLGDLMVRRLNSQLKKLQKTTGREWVFPSGSPPDWILSD